jgi:hypothetical protein
VSGRAKQSSGARALHIVPRHCRSWLASSEDRFRSSKAVTRSCVGHALANLESISLGPGCFLSITSAV